MRLVCLGTGTLDPSSHRATSGHALFVEGRLLSLLDCGFGIPQRLVQFGIHGPGQTPSRLILSHLHPDHTGGLVHYLFALNYAHRPWGIERPFQIWGPIGIREQIEAIQVAFPMTKPRFFELEVVELPEEGDFMLDRVHVRYEKVQHGDMEARAYRFVYDDKVFVYSGDTGLCAGIQNICRQADLFLCECTHDLKDEPKFPSHLTTEEVGKIAQQGEVKKLVLTHLPPHHNDLVWREEIGQYFSGDIISAKDFGVYDIG